MDHDSDYSGVPPVGSDWEIRGSGTTPLAGILSSAKTYLTATQAAAEAALGGLFGPDLRLTVEQVDDAVAWGGKLMQYSSDPAE